MTRSRNANLPAPPSQVVILREDLDIFRINAGQIEPDEVLTLFLIPFH